MNAEEHGPGRSSYKIPRQIPQKEKDDARGREEQKKDDQVVPVRIQIEPREEERRYRLTRQWPVPIRDVQAVESVKKFIPTEEPVRHIKQRVALKELRKTVREDEIFKKTEKPQKGSSRAKIGSRRNFFQNAGLSLFHVRDSHLHRRSEHRPEHR